MKVLIIEDEVKTAAYLKKGLEEEGFSVDLAHDGAEGLNLALSSDYDLLILDVMLPSKNGWEIIREIRQSGKETLALFLTAKDTLDDRIKGLNLGGDAYIVKPFAFSELVAQIRTLLRRIPVRSVDTIVIADLQINLNRRLAFRSGQRLNLSSREFALLALLARRRGEILSRTLISEQVWDIHYDSGSNVVDVHIRRLRAKVDDPFEIKLIKTIRGMGYLIEIDS